jgi:hypothetical protein
MLSVASTPPELSVVVVILGGGAHLERCLTTLRWQENPPGMEVIVPHDDRRPEIASLRAQFPEVQFVHTPGQHTYPELRSAGVKASRGTLVAVTEDQCIPNPQWCANIVAAHQVPRAAIGGPVDKQGPDAALNWAIYLRELGAYMPPVAEGPTHALTDCNVSYRREQLDAIAPVWAEAFHEPNVHGALQARGGTLWTTPALMVYQQRTIALGPAIRERYEFGRLYGRLRAGVLSGAKRYALAAACPLLPFLFVARVYANVFGKKRHVGPALAALPYIALFALVWACGEFVSYWTGRTG